MCFGFSKELSHRDGSFEYPQHMFWLRNNRNDFQLHTLIWGLFNGGHNVSYMYVYGLNILRVFKKKKRCDFKCHLYDE